MKSKYFTLVLFFASLYSLHAQQRFGNEWIDFSQEYYKIPVSQEGIYRITYYTLVNAGINVGSINPKKLQMFYLGKEQYVFINGENDNTFDPGDYIEFYAKKNDGVTDIPLYRTAKEQPHTFFSLYSDTSAYFLTWSSTTDGQRLTPFTDTAYSSYTPETYFMHTVNTIYPEAFYDGQVVMGYGIMSEYSEGEGWLGNFFKRGQTQNRDIATPFAYSSGASPFVTLLWYGVTDVDLPTGVSNNHHFTVKTSPDNVAYRQLIDTMYNGYVGIRRYFDILNSDIGASTTRFQFKIINDLGLVADNNCIGGIFLTYARQFNLNNLSKFPFNFTGLLTGTNSFINFTNYNSTKSNPVVYDNTNHYRIGATLLNNNLRAVVPNAGSAKQVYISDTTDIITVNSMEKIQFVNLNIQANNYDYLIITNEKLLPGATDYATYRSSTGYKPLVVTTKQLYNQFYYGLHNPMALRHFCDYALDKSISPPKYLLLLGKGQLHYLVRSDTIGYNYDLVPTFGCPGSDYMFTSGLSGTHYEPAIPTGRVPAITNADIINYLNKVKEYEITPAQLWQKNVLHLAGGRDAVENTAFTAYLNGYKPIIEGPFVGAKTKLYSKDQAVAVTTGLKTYIQKDIENGLGMLTYFGHGASDILEIDFGGPNEMSNKGKYPIMMFSGCVLGNSFAKGSLGEKYILYPDGGTVAWISNSGYGFSSELDEFTGRYYQNVAIKNYNKAIGDILKQAIADYQDTSGNDIFKVIHARQFAYEGDPAIHLYFKSQPDYSIPNIFLLPRDVSAMSDSFAVAVVVTNTGKAITDSFNISLKRTLPDNSIVQIPSIRKPGTYNTDTVLFWIKSKDVKTKGINYFDAYVDASFEIVESNENNNHFSLQFFMPTNGAQIVSPSQYGIVNKVPLTLRAQANSGSLSNQDFIFEIDTNANFNSTFKITSPVIATNFIAQWQPSIFPTDSMVFYWRVKLNGTGNDAWENSSFIFIGNSPGGWAQKHFQQFNKITSADISLDTTQRKFNFVRKTSCFYSITTFGQNGSSVRTHNQNYWPTRYGTIGDGISIIAYNPDNEERYNYPSQFDPAVQVPNPFPPNNGVVTVKPSGTFFFNTNNIGNANYQAIRDSLRNHIYGIPAGYHIFLHNGRNTGIQNWDTALINAFKSIGATKLGIVKEGWPYLLMTRKNAQAGDAIYEITADTINGIAGPPLAQKAEKFLQIYPLDTSGIMSSEWISGASKWHKVFLWNSGRDNAKDLFNYDIVGLSKTHQEVNLFTNQTSDSLDISSVLADQYPEIKIVMSFNDDSMRSSLQLKHWIVTFDELPEASVNTNLNYYFYKDTLQEGDSIRFNLAFQNISNYGLDSIDVQVKLLDSHNIEDTLLIAKLKPLPANDTLYFGASFSTRGLSGQNTIQVIFNPGIQAEKSYSNNAFQKNVFILNDKINPLLDVTFDGIHINNNEIISPTPDILITATDENKINLLKDTQNFKLFLRSSSGSTQRVNFNTPQITFTPADSVKRKAIIEYKPQHLADGIYTLIVNVTDVAGNKAGINDYTINFEVISKATITNFYPYPNPVNNAMRFVFTLTGESLPQDIKVQISTVTGKVIRTITKEELGLIHIGTNITDVVWNGTDEYGDRLANGVYLFRVIINDKKNTYTLRGSNGDAYFKNNEKDMNKNIGKIYLLR
jgi:hypothetical protein